MMVYMNYERWKREVISLLQQIFINFNDQFYLSFMAAMVFAKMKAININQYPRQVLDFFTPNSIESRALSVFMFIFLFFSGLFKPSFLSLQCTPQRINQWRAMVCDHPYKLEIITSYLFIEQMAYSTAQFSDQEISILARLVPEQKYLQIKKFGELAQQFNEELLKEGIHWKRSGRTLRSQLVALYGKQRIRWSAEMEKRMLAGVAQGKKWTHIAKEELFSINGLNGTKIKQKFQSDMRHKLRTFIQLFNLQEFHGLKSKFAASDKTFKFILSGESNKKIRDNFHPEQISTILKSRPFFMQSLYEANGQKKKIRSLKVKKDLSKAFDDYIGEVHNIAQLLVKLSKLLGKHSEIQPQSNNPLQLALSHNFQLFFGQEWPIDGQYQTKTSPKRTQTLKKKKSTVSDSTKESDIFESISNNDFLMPEQGLFYSEESDLL